MCSYKGACVRAVIQAHYNVNTFKLSTEIKVAYAHDYSYDYQESVEAKSGFGLVVKEIHQRTFMYAHNALFTIGVNDIHNNHPCVDSFLPGNVMVHSL